MENEQSYAGRARTEINSLLKTAGVKAPFRTKIKQTLSLSRSESDWDWLLRQVKTEVTHRQIRHWKRWPDKYKDELAAL